MRVLLVRAGALGDVLLLRPVLAALRGAGHAVGLVAPERPAAVIRDEVEELFAWERPELAALLSGRPAGALDGLVSRCDAVVAFTRDETLRTALAARCPSARGHDPAPPAGRHAADWLLDAVREWAPDAAPEAPPLRSTAAERAQAARLLDRLAPGFLALHTGSGSAAKNWPRERFRLLADRLSPGASFLVVRGEADASACAELATEARVVLADGLPLRVLGAVLARAGVVVGNDSGISHLAAAYGAATLTLFGPTDPRSWRPLGPQARFLASPTSAIEDLELDAVAAEACELLARFGLALPSG